MNHHTDSECIYCGSTMFKRRGHPHCSGDNLPAMKKLFDSILELEASTLQFESRLESLKENEYSFDLFYSYWNLKKRNSEVGIECIHEDTYIRSLEPEEYEIPMPSGNVDLPDLIEVYIAEIMLGRELKPLEKDQSIPIPKIDENGNHYTAPLSWVKFPISYMSESKDPNKTLSLNPLKKVFDIEAIRNCKKGL